MGTDAVKQKRSRGPGGRILLVLGLLAVLVYLFNKLVLDGCADSYDDTAMHFKYGSIGSDNLRRGIPYRIWQILPEMFPQHLPHLPQCQSLTYEAFGLTMDPKDRVDRPIGFSKRWRFGAGEFIGINCAFCHVSTVRATPDGPTRIILGMPANTVDAEAFFRFLFAAADDPDFTTENVLKHIEQKGRLGYWEKFIHRYLLIPAFQDGAKSMKHKFGFLDRRPTPFGPGRVDTWAYYKVEKLQDSLQIFEKLPAFGAPTLEMDPGALSGIADFPALWREKLPQGALHWDGNNRSPQERNITAALGAGATPATLDLRAVTRIATWFEADDYAIESYHSMVPGPKTDPLLAEKLVAKGLALFTTHCHKCHGRDGAQTSGIVGIKDIGTDQARLDAFSEALSDKLNEVHHLAAWRLENYWKTNGYANLLLTGIWLRAPYLHNGSVPTLWHLLQDPSKRPVEFCRGNNLYDWDHVGFQWDPGADDCSGSFKYDTRLPGNGNGGHVYGTNLPDQDKRALMEYLKTL
ncbi:MAG: hypothetical protein NTNFB02_33200 [Nitrospira sp.]